MSLVPPPRGLPPAYGGCACSCHRVPGVMHIAACCRPTTADFVALEAMSEVCKVHCSICEGSDHHWLPDFDDETAEPVMECKHCGARRDVTDEDLP